MEAADFWDEPENSAKTLKSAKELELDIDEYEEVCRLYEETGIMIELGYEEDDISVLSDINDMLEELDSRLEVLKTRTLLSGTYDRCNAIIKLNAGVGGTEACDWCEMLYRMYTRWIQSKGYVSEVLDVLSEDEAGIKSITMQVSGENAYGYLKSEHGIHRLIRISPFNAAGKRQTSFASCDIMPDIEEDVDIEIASEDLRIDTYRASGAGGQHINKTSSAVRITHVPTGVVVQCQNERSQLRNKEKAMQLLKAKLYLLQQEANVEKLSDIRGDVKDIGWGSQIRTYVMHPYTMVKDHRTGCESGNVSAVLDGDLDKYMSAYLTWLSLGGDAVDVSDVE